MMYLANVDFDKLIGEDTPYFDLTSYHMGIDEQMASIVYFTRENCVVCGTEEAAEVFKRLGIELKFKVNSGTFVDADTELLKGYGSAGNVHKAWKVCQNLIDHMSGIATKSKRLVDAVHKENPGISVLTTRKMFPGTKALAIKAVMAGGAVPHRLGLSESILIFKQHSNIIGGTDNLIKMMPQLKSECCEKRILVEAEDLEYALNLLEAGCDGIQFDKLSAVEICEAAEKIREKYPDALILAAGGINEKNASQFAKSKIDGIVTTSLYSAPATDIGVKIQRAE